jgi:bifunctional pyridoxal-dependent enzyme with beta-cystathionase and maltose regulon repressor activities
MSNFVRQLDSQKWGNTGYGDDKFVLTIADMDIPLYEPLKKSIIARISVLNNFTYKDPSEEYYKAVIEWYRRRHIKDAKTEVSKEDIVDSPSLLNSIYLLLQTLTQEGDGVLLMTPVFYNYVKIIKYLKRKVI